MNFSLSDEQKQFQELALKFANNEMIPFAQELDEKGEFPKDIIKKAWELGLLNTCIPTEYGGAGFSNLDSVIISECLAYGCMGINTSMMANDLALLPIVIAGTHEQKQKFLTPFTESPKIASFCLTEPNYGSDAAGIKTTFKEDGDHWIINGDKMWITNAGYADLLVVYGSINTDLKHKGISCIVIDAKSEGIEVGKKEDKMGHRASDTRAIRFNNVKVPKENLLGTPGGGWIIAMKTLDHSRPLVASSAVGGSWRALECVKTYAKERHQFGKPIGQFQSVSNRIVDMNLRLEMARLLLYKTAWLKQNGESAIMESAMLKLHLSESFFTSSMDTIRTFGGMGYLSENEIERDLRDAVGGVLYAGTSDIQRNIISKLLGL